MRFSAVTTLSIALLMSVFLTGCNCFDCGKVTRTGIVPEGGVCAESCECCASQAPRVGLLDRIRCQERTTPLRNKVRSAIARQDCGCETEACGCESTTVVPAEPNCPPLPRLNLPVNAGKKVASRIRNSVANLKPSAQPSLLNRVQQTRALARQVGNCSTNSDTCRSAQACAPKSNCERTKRCAPTNVCAPANNCAPSNGYAESNNQSDLRIEDGRVVNVRHQKGTSETRFISIKKPVGASQTVIAEPTPVVPKVIETQVKTKPVSQPITRSQPRKIVREPSAVSSQMVDVPNQLKQMPPEKHNFDPAYHSTSTTHPKPSVATKTDSKEKKVSVKPTTMPASSPTGAASGAGDFRETIRQQVRDFYQNPVDKNPLANRTPKKYELLPEASESPVETLPVREEILENKVTENPVKEVHPVFKSEQKQVDLNPAESEFVPTPIATSPNTTEQVNEKVEVKETKVPAESASISLSAIPTVVSKPVVDQNVPAANPAPLGNPTQLQAKEPAAKDSAVEPTAATEVSTVQPRFAGVSLDANDLIPTNQSPRDKPAPAANVIVAEQLQSAPIEKPQVAEEQPYGTIVLKARPNGNHVVQKQPYANPVAEFNMRSSKPVPVHQASVKKLTPRKMVPKKANQLDAMPSAPEFRALPDINLPRLGIKRTLIQAPNLRVTTDKKTSRERLLDIQAVVKYEIDRRIANGELLVPQENAQLQDDTHGDLDSNPDSHRPGSLDVLNVVTVPLPVVIPEVQSNRVPASVLQLDAEKLDSEVRSPALKANIPLETVDALPQPCRDCPNLHVPTLQLEGTQDEVGTMEIRVPGAPTEPHNLQDSIVGTGDGVNLDLTRAPAVEASRMPMLRLKAYARQETGVQSPAIARFLKASSSSQPNGERSGANVVSAPDDSQTPRIKATPVFQDYNPVEHTVRTPEDDAEGTPRTIDR